MTLVQLICVIGSFAIFVLVAWWCINHDCYNNSQWQKAIDKMTEEKFPYMWKETRPTIDKYVMQKLIELEHQKECISYKRDMNQNEKKIVEWFFDLVGYFNHYEFFTKKLWKKVKGFEREDEAEIKCMFMHYWFHHKFGYYTCPCGSSWFTIVDKDSYDRYITKYKPIIDTFEIWTEKQR